MDEKEMCFCCTQLLERRTVLKAALGMMLGLQVVDLAEAQEADSKTAPPKEGDQFVFIFGDKKGEVITPEDLPLNATQVLAYPMDPRTSVVKDGTRFNRILLIHLDPAELTEETRAHSVNGILAYSAICTHQACDVAAWHDEKKVFICPCHESQFDPRDGARVVFGPAPRRLSALPLKLVDGVLMAAGGFLGPVGPKRS
ncbi:MAG: Rieske (2Fe-2S) protein [Nitrospira sp.]|nr:Rieske (2Fe-2S) protein [Nitrospira sp.]